jgi:peptide-O-fucosyltransferase
MEAKHVFVATDDKDLIDRFRKEFKQVKFTRLTKDNPQVDLCIMGKADHTIVNCVSTFSAFAKRQRDIENKTTEFWAFKPKSEKEL